jgi:hypothetical protein
MAKWNTTWKVSPHGPLEKLSDRLWRVEAKLEGLPLHRVMTVARRADGTLVVHNAIPLSEDAMAELDAWGKVATIVVPNRFHRLDALPFSQRYPEARVLCPAGATKQREGAMIVRGDVTSVVFNDAVFNMDHAHGFMGFMLRLVGASGPANVDIIVRWFIISDKKAFRSHFEQLAELPRLAHIVVSHHKVITEEPAAMLRQLVARF